MSAADGSTWSFGGFFPDPTSCAGLGPGDPDEGHVPPWFNAAAPLPAPRPGTAWTDVTVPHNRRLRDGWSERESGRWERPLADGGVAVVSEQVHPTPQVVTEAAIRRSDDSLLALGADASLDVDRAGRALVGRDGRLEIHTGGGRMDVVADVTGQRPDPAPPPAWAYRWPVPPSRRT